MTKGKKCLYGGRKTFRKHVSNKRHHKRGGSKERHDSIKNRVRSKAIHDKSLFPTALTVEEVEAKLRTPPKPKVPSPSPRPLTHLSRSINLATSSKTLKQKAKLLAEKKRLFDNAPEDIKSILLKKATRIPLNKDEKERLNKYHSSNRK